MWIEEQPGTTKINQMRLEDALKTGAETVVTACLIVYRCSRTASNIKG